MLTFLNRHLMHPLAAWRAGSKHLRHLRELRRTQFDPPEVIRTRQLAALQAHWDVLQLQAARSKPILHMHRMAAENPVWIVCAQPGGEGAHA